MVEQTKNLRIGDLLKEYGYVSEKQLADALEYQKSHKGLRLGQALLEMGVVTEQQVMQALAARMHLEIVKLGSYPVDLNCVRKIPRMLAEKYGMLPIGMRDGNMILAVNDPLNFYGIEDIRQVSGMSLTIVLAEEQALSKAIGVYYAEIDAMQAATRANQESEKEVADALEGSEEDDDDTPVIRLLSRLVERAYNTNASDIHIEPFENKTVVRMRIDGAIVEYVTLQKSLHASLIARIKILGEMDIAERRIPQDGHFRTRVRKEQVNIRVSVIPTVYGEKAVLRLLNNHSVIAESETFGMQRGDYEKVRKLLEAPNGILYFTGPTGSGKTTTLYMILEYLSGRAVNISTIEDPVEKNIPGINQMQINPQAGLTFESGLRALLRQDPDILMVGETRDAETAEISVRASITGHLVFSTLHTNDAPSSIVRLEDMGVQPYLIAASLTGVVAQRLMRRVCPECSVEEPVTEEEQELLGPKIRSVHRAKGCPSCNYTGYQGRIAIHEVLVIDRNVRNMILNHASIDEIRTYAETNQKMHSLRESALAMVERGITTIEEFKKITYYI
ncbi:MAG: ATPase, T2SS/T4P/T4SS family [Lachnospiraceae bacterium]|nr:ATPase, T2SS/T4P/T4SS family [Lachnospiraceae bacterium]